MIELINVRLRLRSRLYLLVMSLFHKSMLAIILRSKHQTIAWYQLKVAAMPMPIIKDVPIRYEMTGKSPGHQFGNFDNTSQPVVLWLHGGAFVLPAAPANHHRMLGKLCQKLNAAAFMPDYRLAPNTPFPAALNDCETAYHELLNMGYAPTNIVLGGDSAGGNLVFGLLQRIRKNMWPMPSCAIALSPSTEMGRTHGPTSRHENRNSDTLIPANALSRVWKLYGDNQDSSDPEISPLYMDCHDLPPLLFIAGSDEMLRDDSVLLAKRCHAAGVPTTCHIWSKLPHSFPLFSHIIIEAEKACEDITSFAQSHLNGSNI